MVNKIMFILSALAAVHTVHAQTDSLAQSRKQIDSLYIDQSEHRKHPPKIMHAEPLYIDLIRDLGARKGEKEWNIGFGITDNQRFDTYSMLVEYEFAPVDRLGIEFEIPFVFPAAQKGVEKDSIPAGGIESLKTAAQWTFCVSEKHRTSLAIGYIHEIELNDFRHFGKPVFTGNVYNPFFVAARRWGTNLHTLLYTGPRIGRSFQSKKTHMRYDINSNFHYMVPRTRNFIGVEVNKTIEQKDFDMTIRPQMRLGIADNFLVGIVGGIPVNRENQRFSMFMRIIWEPGHKRT